MGLVSCSYSTRKIYSVFHYFIEHGKSVCSLRERKPYIMKHVNTRPSTKQNRENTRYEIKPLYSYWRTLFPLTSDTFVRVHEHAYTSMHTRVVSLYTCVCINIHVLMHAYTLCFRIGLIIKHHWGWDRHYLAQFEPHFWNAQHPWSPLSSHCSFWTSCKAHYGKLRLMTKCNVLKLLKVFGFPLIFFCYRMKSMKNDSFFHSNYMSDFSNFMLAKTTLWTCVLGPSL